MSDARIKELEAELEAMTEKIVPALKRLAIGPQYEEIRARIEHRLKQCCQLMPLDQQTIEIAVSIVNDEFDRYIPAVDAPDTKEAIRENLERFAAKHKLILADRGEVGFYRPCVGFLSGRGQGFLEYNPLTYPSYERISALSDSRLRAPDAVPDAYHKHDCYAVLAHDKEGGSGPDYDEALRQLDLWVRHLESQGELEVVAYETGATGLQSMITGVVSYALTYKKVVKDETI